MPWSPPRLLGDSAIIRAEMPPLDETDAAIVRALQEDARVPYSVLAELAGVSETHVRRRVRALLDADVISLTTVADPRVFGLDWMAWVALSARHAEVPQIAERLVAMPAINYVVVTAGSVDVLAEVACTTADELLALLVEIRALPGVRRSDTLIFLRLLQQRFEWGPARDVPGRHPMTLNNEQAELDAEDIAIVRSLAVDARASFRAMSRDLGISQRRISEKFTRLVDSGIIRVSAVANPTNLGFNAMAWLGIQVYANADFEAVASQIAAVPAVSYLAATAGRYDLMAEVACHDREELLNTLAEEISSIDGVDHIDTAFYLRLLYRRTVEPWSAARSLSLRPPGSDAG
jgi:DNA-binding Lrp family transcriptional regulator